LSETDSTAKHLDTTKLPRKRTTQKYLEKRSGERNLVSGADGERQKWQHKTELGGDKWAMTHTPLGETRHKSTQVKI